MAAAQVSGTFGATLARAARSTRARSPRCRPDCTTCSRSAPRTRCRRWPPSWPTSPSPPARPTPSPVSACSSSPPTCSRFPLGDRPAARPPEPPGRGHAAGSVPADRLAHGIHRHRRALARGRAARCSGSSTTGWMPGAAWRACPWRCRSGWASRSPSTAAVGCPTTTTAARTPSLPAQQVTAGGRWGGGRPRGARLRRAPPRHGAGEPSRHAVAGRATGVAAGERMRHPSVRWRPAPRWSGRGRCARSRRMPLPRSRCSEGEPTRWLGPDDERRPGQPRAVEDPGQGGGAAHGPLSAHRAGDRAPGPRAGRDLSIVTVMGAPAVGHTGAGVRRARQRPRRRRSGSSWPWPRWSEPAPSTARCSCSCRRPAGLRQLRRDGRRAVPDPR